MVYRAEDLPLFGPDNHSWENLATMFMAGKWYSATPSAIREMSFNIALQYTRDHLDEYRSRDPENLIPSNLYLQLLWLGSGIHIDVPINTLPSRSKLLPSPLSVGLTKLFYYARKRKGPHIRKTDKGMGLGIQSKAWFHAQRSLVLNDATKYLRVPEPNLYVRKNASKIYMMAKIHKQRTPTPGRILVQGFSWLEASAKFISFYGYTILKQLTTPIAFHKIRAEYEYKGLDMALNEICEINCACGEPPTLVELDVEACYPSIKHDTVNRAFMYFFQFVPANYLTVYINVWARSLYLLNHTYIQVNGIVYQQKSGLSQGSAAAPFLADFSLFMLDLKFRALFPFTWHGRYLDDILLVIPPGEDVAAITCTLQSLFADEQQEISIQTAGSDGWAAWLGFEIHPLGRHRVYVKPTWTNLFSPLYDAISPRLHIGYLLIITVRFITFSYDNELFITIWERFCAGLPARGYPHIMAELIRAKIKYATGFDPYDHAGHNHLKTRFGFWLRQTKTYRKEHANLSPYRELWQGTLSSSELLHINVILSRDFQGDRPMIRPSPTWTITTLFTDITLGTRIRPRWQDNTIAPPSPDGPSDAYSIGSHSALRSDNSLPETDYSDPVWWTATGQIDPNIAFNMSWHDAITTQFSSRLPGGAGDSDLENPLRVGAPIPGTSSDLVIGSPLSTLLNEKACYDPLLLEEPTIEELEEQSVIFNGNILPIASFLYDAQILPSYRKSWLPAGHDVTGFSATPSSVATTTIEIALLQHTHRKAAVTEIATLQQELASLHTMDAGDNDEL